MTYHDRPNPGWAGVVIGLTIIAVGIVLLLDQTGIVEWNLGHLWPVILIAIGLARFAQPQADGSRSGGWLIVIGFWLLLNELHLLRVRDSWPLLLVALGVHTMWKAIARPAPPSSPSSTESSS